MTLAEAFAELAPLVGGADVVARRQQAFERIYDLAGELSRKIVRPDRREDVLSTLMINLLRGGPRHDHPRRPLTDGAVTGYLINALRNIQLDLIKQQRSLEPVKGTEPGPAADAETRAEARLLVESVLFDMAVDVVGEAQAPVLRELQAVVAGRARPALLAEQAAGPGAATAEIERARRQRTSAYRRAALRLLTVQAAAAERLDLMQRDLLPAVVDEICADVGLAGKWFGQLPTAEMAAEIDAAEQLLMSEIVQTLPGSSGDTVRELVAIRRGDTTFEELVAAEAGPDASPKATRQARDRLYQRFSRTLFRLAAAADARAAGLQPARLDALLYLIADLALEERKREAGLDVRLDE